MAPKIPEFSKDQVVRLWFSRQGLNAVDTPQRLQKRSFVELLNATGGLQVDSVNVVDRAHYLTLWSRFGKFDRRHVDQWIYKDKLAYEYWGHEASILPMSHLPIGMRRMRRFPPDRWKESAYWARYDTSAESKRRVLRLLKQHGALESADFKRSKVDSTRQEKLGWGALMPKEDKRSLNLLWHAGKVAICGRRHFRKVYDLATNVYPKQAAASLTQYQDSWLLVGLSGNGIASAKHLANYITGPNLKADEREQVIERNLRRKTIVEVRVQGSSERYFALPEVLDDIDAIAQPIGTTLLCPFDSLLWQRGRAEELLGFHYRVEIYVPEPKRRFGYYVMPILHHGKLVGRLDPKLHRSDGRLEVKSLYFEEGFRPNAQFKRRLNERLEGLADFLGASILQVPRK